MELLVLNKGVLCECLTVLMLLRHAIGDDDMDYLKKYGYLEKASSASGNLVSEDYMKQAVRTFQKMAGLPVTGTMDQLTKDTMTLPRCGVSDTVGTGNKARRKKRYALHGSKWPKHEITYKILEYSRKLSAADIERELQRAFDLWSEVIPIKFTKKDYGYADIRIKFVSGHHNDTTPFDGNGQTLAHAYFPQYGGDAHFDEDERWTVNIPEGVNLFQVAAHEFGHSLGLAHSDERSALMAPFYRGFDRNFKLDQDDIIAVQELYGSPSVYVSPTKAPSFPMVKIPDICRNASIDAITRTEDGNTYVFQGSSYYRLGEQEFDTKYPRPIEDWANISGPIDAALTWPNGWTFLFKGTQYWKFHNLQPIYGPKNISEGFDGIPGDLDAAFVWSGNGKTYFIKGKRYWRYYGNRVDYDYPRNLSVWNGLPSRIHAAFQWKNGRTYFFSGSEYYRYNDQLFNVDTAGYPRETGVWWLLCLDKKQIAAYDRAHGRKSDVRFGFLNGERGSEEQWVTVRETQHSSGLYDNKNNGAVQITIELQVYCIYLLFICFYAKDYFLASNR